MRLKLTLLFTVFAFLFCLFEAAIARTMPGFWFWFALSLLNAASFAYLYEG